MGTQSTPFHVQDVLLSAITGKLISENIQGKNENELMKPFSIRRFNQKNA